VPRVTVIIATYNWAPVLPYSIGSVLDQTFTDFELLVVGDGCTDDSADVVARVGDGRVSWHNLPENTGHQSGPDNDAIAHARGDVIAYLGHDDLWLPRHLEVLLGAIDDDGARIAHATTLFVEPGRAPVQRPPAGWEWSPDAWLPPTSVVHDRAVVAEAGGWRHPRDTGVLDPETELWGRIAAVAHPPRWARRLTSVKLPAALRRDVYRERPCAEQATWLARIRAATDPEAEFTREYRSTLSWTDRIVGSVRSTVRLRTRLHRLGILRTEPHRETAEERRQSRRRFKGLDR